jgi:isopenicillin N synthase-like dioxygenase
VIPVIDLSSADAPSAIDRACREIGFFQIVGHGLDPAIETLAWEVAAEFFDLPLADKLAVAIPEGDAYGYGPFAIERLAASRGDDTPPDLKETFSVGPLGPVPTGLADDPAAAFVYSPNRWPAGGPDMERALRAYYDELAELVARLMALMAVGLGLEADHFAAFIDRHTSALRALHYPALAGRHIEPGQLRAGAHSDYGTLTLLRQDTVGGLQVCDVAGTWHDVACIPGAYVVNVGDALERWTNDAWRSTLHRVRVPHRDDGRSRQSMAFFHNANWDAVIECIPTCLASGDEPRYAPVGAGRHLMDKFRSTQT